MLGLRVDSYCNIDMKEFSDHEDEVNCVAFSSDFEIIITGCDDCCVRVFNAKTGRLVCRVSGHDGPVRCVAARADSKYFASGSYDSTVRIWRTQDAQLWKLLLGHSKSVEALSFTANGCQLVSGSWDRSAIVWDVGSGVILKRLYGHNNVVQSLAVSSDGRYLATGSWDYTIRVWTLPKFPVAPLETENVNPNCSDSPDSEDIHKHDSGLVNPVDAERSDTNADSVNSSAEGDFKHEYSATRSVNSYLDTSLGEVAKTEVNVNDVIKQDTKLIIDSQTADDYPYIVLLGHTGNIHALAFSRAGMLASGSWDKSVRLWNPRDGKCLHSLFGHTGWVRAVCFSQDSCYVASAADDDKVRVWDVVSGQCMKQLEGRTFTYQQCGFTPAGALVVSGACYGVLSVR